MNIQTSSLMENQTIFFYIVTFSSNVEERVLFFYGFFLLYLISVVWNMMIFTVIYLDSCLHIPMYFFLRNLSFLDILYTSVTLPKLLDIILTGNNKISVFSCFAQMILFISLACAEIFLLTTMSYDRYVAICQPLYYTILMDKRTCSLLVASCWIIGCLNSFFIAMFASKLTFCGSRNINYIFCDIKALTTVSCGNKQKIEIMIYVETVIVGACPFLLILTSYFKIIYSILKVHSIGQRSKMFSTCTSHLIVLLIFYGALFCMYIRPLSENSEQLDLIFSILYLAVTPTLNPLIYSLRNKDIRASLGKMLKLNS